MIEIGLVKWKNFLSYGNQYTSLDFNTFNAVLLTGSNGNGKSTIMDVLCFGLFGKPYRKIKLGQLVNSINGRDLSVEIHFKKNGHDFIVERGIKPNIFLITKDGVPLDQASNIRDFQKYLEKNILETSYKTFIQVGFIGNSNYIPFMRMSTQVRREIIEDLLSLNVYGDMLVEVKKQSQELNSIIKDLKKDIQIQEEKINFVTAQEEQLKRHSETLTQEYSTALETVSNQIHEKEQQYKTLASTLQDHKPLPSLGKIPYFHSRLEGNIQQCKNDIDFFNTSGTCPRCKQDITTTYKEQLVEELKQSIAKFTDALEELNRKKEVIDTQIQEAKTFNTAQDETLQAISSVKTSLIHLHKEKERLQNIISSFTEIPTQEINEDTIRQIKTALETLEQQLEEKQEELDVISKAMDVLKPGGIQSVVLEYCLPVLNHLFTKYLDLLGFQVRFELTPTLEENIQSRYRDQFSYENFSDGEKAKIDLAIAFSFREFSLKRNNLPFGFLILDEADKALDQDASDMLKNVISTLQETTKLIIISHKENLLSTFNGKTLSISKSGNFSIIE